MVKKLFPILTILFFALCSCQNKGGVRDQIDSDTISGFDPFNEVKEVYYRFPSPDEMLSIIDHEQFYFNDEILLPVEKANNYLDSRSQALNLGVYIADLAYITLFERQKEALTYFQVVYGLSEKLRISSAFDVKILKRFEDNLGNVDSLKMLADESLTDITQYLEREDKGRTLAVISIGGFIETLYLAFQMVDEYSADNMVVQRISDQKLVLENLMNYALTYAGDRNVSEAINTIHPIRALYNELVASEVDTDVKRTEDGKLIISGGSRISISEEQFNKLRETTNMTRKSITDYMEN